MPNRCSTLVTASAILCLCFVLIAFSGFTQHSNLTSIMSGRFLEESSCGLFIKITSNVQLWLLTHPNIPFGSTILSILYSIDNITYLDRGKIDGPKKFLSARQECLGKNFATLGRVYVTNYSETVALIEAPQKKGYFLGSARMNPNYMPEKFLLFLSDEAAGGSELHSQLHSLMWNTVALPALNRTMTDEGGAFASYLSEGKENMNLAGADKSTEIIKMTIRYVWHAIFGKAIDEDTVTMVFDRFVGLDVNENLFLGATMPFSLIFGPRQDGVSAETLTQLILDSPYMETYEPSSEYGNLPKEEWAELLLSIVGIAGILGTSGLNNNIEQYASVADGIDTTSEEDLTLAVLESARIRPPVNEINTIIQEHKTMIVNGNTVTLPADTVVASGVGPAGLDEDEFPDPHTFDHTRANLLNSTLNFNRVGWNTDTPGTRACPGRVIAMKMGIDWLTLLKEVPYVDVVDM